MTTDSQHWSHGELEQPDASVEQAVEAGEANRRRFPRFSQAPATYLLLAINFLVYAAMLRYGPLPTLIRHHMYGASLTASFNIDVLAYFGGCDGALVLEHHQWWRVVTATFVHVNLLHILVNMWCLWNLGLLGEPLLGRPGMIATYLITGAAGNLCSLAVNAFLRQEALVAGASGAVFGIAGILIILLSNRGLSLPWAELKSLRRSVVQFAVLNLLIGLAPQILMPMVGGAARSMAIDLSPLTHIDNTAHLGGLACGLALGLPLFPRMMSGRARYRSRQRWTFAGTALLLSLFAYSIKTFHGQ